MTSTHARSAVIGYISPAIYSSYYRLLLGGVQRAARERHARLIVFQMSAADIVRSQISRTCVDGWVACYAEDDTASLEALAAWGRPLVMISQPVSGAPLVVTDNVAGMRAVVEHLARLGHRRIAFVGWKENPDIPGRLVGYRQALEAHGIAFDPDLIYMGAGGSVGAGAEVMARILAADTGCTAVACANDNLALGAMRHLRQVGMRVPEDMAVTGFDDVPEAQIADPPLTTVRMRFDAMSRAATEHLLDILAGAPPADTPIVIPMSLVVRRSAGEPVDLLAEDIAEPPAPGSAALPRTLAETIGAPETLAPDEPPNRLWPGVDTVVAAVEAALSGDPPPDDSALQRAWASAVQLAAYADPLQGALMQIEAATSAALARLPSDDPAHRRVALALHRLRTTLLRACVGGQVERIDRSETALSFSNEIARTLADNDLDHACGLAWLGRSGVSAGVLGLWEGEGPERRLRIAGRYPAGAGGEPPVPAAQFPPLASLGGDEAPVTVLPLRSARRDWGFLTLALPGSLETAAFDSAPLLAALLTARIDSATLQQEREQQQAALLEAYERERSLADTVRELGCPVIPLNDSALLVPLIGVIDTQRAEQIIATLLHAVETQRAGVVLLDVTGVPLIDTHVAGVLVRLAQMLRLLGARALLVGVRPEIAQSMVALGVDLSGLTAHSSLKEALASIQG